VFSTASAPLRNSHNPIFKKHTCSLISASTLKVHVTFFSSVPAARGRFPAYRGVQSSTRHTYTIPNLPHNYASSGNGCSILSSYLWNYLVTVPEAAEAISLNLHHLMANGWLWLPHATECRCIMQYYPDDVSMDVSSYPIKVQAEISGNLISQTDLTVRP